MRDKQVSQWFPIIDLMIAFSLILLDYLWFVTVWSCSALSNILQSGVIWERVLRVGAINMV